MGQTTFVADLTSGKQVGDEVRAALAGDDELKIAVAFVGAGIGERLGVNLQRRKIRLICDAESGFCNPYELRKIARRPNITGRYLAGLHAKVFISERAVVIGSANVSTNAMDHGSLEAVTISTEPAMLKQANRWFDELEKSGKPLKRFVASTAFEDLLTRWPKSPGGLPVSTLLTALQRGDKVLEGFVVGFHETDAMLPERQVKEAAKAEGIELPPSSRWERYEEPYTKEAERVCRKTFEENDRKMITFAIRTEGSGQQMRITEFAKLDQQVGQYVGHHKVDDQLVSHFMTVNPSGVSLAGADAKTLCKLLTTAIQRDLKAGRRLSQQPFWITSVDELRALLVPAT